MWSIAIGPRSSSCIVRRLLASSVYNFSFLTSSWKTRQIKKKSNILYNCFFVTFCSLNISGKRKELYCGIYNIWPHYPGALWAVQICQKKKKEKKKRPNFKKLKKISTGIMALCLVQFGHILVIEKMYLILKNLQQGKITWMHGCMYDVHEAIYLYSEIRDPWFSGSDLGWGHLATF